MVHSGRFRLKSGGMQSCACLAFWVYSIADGCCLPAYLFSRAMCLVFIMHNTIQTECSTRNSASFLCMACVCTSFAPFGNPSLCLLARRSAHSLQRLGAWDIPILRCLLPCLMA